MYQKGLAISRRNFTVLSSVVVALVLAGCASAPERPVSREVAPYVTLANAHDPLNPDELSPYLGVATSGVAKGTIPYYQSQRGHALNVLAISGGGQNGAFGAGFLKGWTESGRRPEFDIVTGVSTGALLATHAFLGTPADDAVLEELYTQTTARDIYRNKGILSVALGADSLKNTAPLAALIAKYITPEVLERMAAAYDDNRRLYVGTTNIDYDQTWVWNMTRLAKEGGPDALERYRKVLLASASFPIVFPPVEIDGHLFVDGAARANMVVIGTAGLDRPKTPPYGPGNVYIIANGRLEHPPQTVDDKLLPLAGTTIAVMMNASMESVTLRAFLAAKYNGYNFNMAEIPAGTKVGKDPLAFDQTQMRAAFDAGRALAKQPNPWVHTPPNVGDIPEWMMEVVP